VEGITATAAGSVTGEGERAGETGGETPNMQPNSTKVDFLRLAGVISCCGWLQ
jgi:hypothetical protein